MKYLLAIFSLMLMFGCSTTPMTERGRKSLDYQCARTVQKYRHSGLGRMFDNCAAYAVFPSIAKGAASFGGAYGRGQMFQNGQMIGYCDLSQGSFGLQLGGQVYSEVIFFRDQLAADHFKSGNFAFAAQASAVAAVVGATADVDYEGGVAVYSMSKAGLMYEAALGGQKFTFEPG